MFCSDFFSNSHFEHFLSKAEWLLEQFGHFVLLQHSLLWWFTWPQLVQVVFPFAVSMAMSGFLILTYRSDLNKLGMNGETGFLMW